MGWCHPKVILSSGNVVRDALVFAQNSGKIFSIPESFAQVMSSHQLLYAVSYNDVTVGSGASPTASWPVVENHPTKSGSPPPPAGVWQTYLFFSSSLSPSGLLIFVLVLASKKVTGEALEKKQDGGKNFFQQEDFQSRRESISCVAASFCLQELPLKPYVGVGRSRQPLPATKTSIAGIENPSLQSPPPQEIHPCFHPKK